MMMIGRVWNTEIRADLREKYMMERVEKMRMI